MNCLKQRDLFSHQSPHDFFIGVLFAAHVTTETVFIQLFAGISVPETAGVRRNFIRQNNGAVRKASKLNFKINDNDVAVFEHVILQELVDLKGVIGNGVQFFTGCPAPVSYTHLDVYKRQVQKAVADSLKLLSEANPTDKVLTLKSFEAFEKAADGKATKIIIPSEIQSLGGLAASLKGVLSDETPKA